MNDAEIVAPPPVFTPRAIREAAPAPSAAQIEHRLARLERLVGALGAGVLVLLVVIAIGVLFSNPWALGYSVVDQMGVGWRANIRRDTEERLRKLQNEPDAFYRDR